LLLSDVVDKPTTPQLTPGAMAVEKTNMMKKELLDALEKLGGKLPPNTLDELIDELGGPDCVAEVCFKYY